MIFLKFFSNVQPATIKKKQKTCAFDLLMKSFVHVTDNGMSLYILKYRQIAYETAVVFLSNACKYSLINVPS